MHSWRHLWKNSYFMKVITDFRHFLDIYLKLKKKKKMGFLRYLQDSFCLGCSMLWTRISVPYRWVVPWKLSYPKKIYYGLYSCLFYPYSKIEILIKIYCNRSFMHCFLYMKETAPLLLLSHRLINGFSLEMHGVKFSQHTNIVCIRGEVGGNNFESYLNDCRTEISPSIPGHLYFW